MTRGTVLVFGLSEAASAIAHRLVAEGWSAALAADAPPKVQRRRMSFADAWWDGAARLAGVGCRRIEPARLVLGEWPFAFVPLLQLGPAEAMALLPWDVVVDGRVAKRRAPLSLRGRAPLTIGCGPGHVAGLTCDRAIETEWGERLGAVIDRGPTAALAGEPRAIDGIGRERLVQASVAGDLTVIRDIGDPVAAGETVARLGARPVVAPIAGTLRGMLRSGITVAVGDKLLEVDPRPPQHALFTGIGQRPAGIAEGVRRAISDTSQSSPKPPHFSPKQRKTTP